MMKKCNGKFERVLRRASTMALVVFSALSLSGCFGSGGDDDYVVDGGGDGTPVSAFNFNADNTVIAAKLAADTMSFFPAFTVIGHTVISTLVVSEPNNSPFDLMACANSGSSVLTWNDADRSGDLTAGDTTSLAFTDCDINGIANGTINFAITSADLDQSPPVSPDSVAMNVTTNLSIFDDPDTAVFTASFKAEMNTADNNVFTIVYTADDPSGQKIAVSENGATLYQFGCFDVTETYSPSTSGTYQLTPNGVINTASKIMSLVGPPHPQLTFSSDMMETGIKTLFSLAVPGCASVGVANGVGDSDGSYLDMEATGGGNITLRTYDKSDAEIFTTETTWHALLLN
jgi:hypothetical protein